MTGLKMTFSADGCSIDWGAEVSGLELLAQKVVVNMMTDRGSDKLIPARGNDLRKQLLGTGAYDLQGVQHALNFSAAKTARDIRQYSDNTDTTELVRKFNMRLTSLSNGVVSTNLTVTNTAGVTMGQNLDI